MSTALLFNAFPVQRSGARRGGRSVAMSLLDEGWNVLLYPEGTRSVDGSLGQRVSELAAGWILAR
jgi:1-acyl-sn-glycerol-3-phosphate acyltransferase